MMTPQTPTVFEEYAAKTLRKRELEAQIKDLNREIEEMEQRALDELINAGLTNVKLATGATVFLAHDIWASLVDDEDGTKNGAHAALKRARLGYLVKNNVNVQSLSALARELDKEGKDFTPSVKPWVNVTKTPRVRVRAG